MMLAATAAEAGCPVPSPGEALPIEAQAEELDNPPWRERVARLDQQLADADLSRFDLVFLGDSITEAWDPPLFSRNFGPRALNLGVRGDTTQGMLWRLPRLRLGAALRPKLIVLLIGTNDTWPGGDPRKAAIGVGEVVRQIRARTPESRILLVGILPRGPDGSDPWRVMGAGMNRLIPACADGKKVFYADPGVGLVDSGGHLSPEIAGDLLHPTPRGYAILAAALGPQIRRLRGEK
jgi:beta-glucosidase